MEKIYHRLHAGSNPRSDSTMKNPSFEVFEADARAKGFDEIVERRWDADTVLDTHAHGFDVEAVVTQGEMWLTCDGSTRHLLPGDIFA